MSAQTMLQQAMILHQQGRLAEAETLYQAVLAHNPRELNTLHLLGVLRQQQGRAGEAVNLLAGVIQAAPNIAVVHSNYGNALKDLGRVDEAIESYRKALALDPGFNDARYNLGRVFKDRGDFAKAAECFAAVLARESGSLALHNDLGLMLQELGRSAEAAAQYRAAVLLAPDQAVPHCNLGNALLAAGDPAGAEASLRKALALQPGLPEALLGLGDVFRTQQRYEEAIAQYRLALPGAPANAVLRNNLGLALMHLDQVEAAVSALGEAVVLQPRRAEIRINYGNALNRQGRSSAALAEFQTALRFDPASRDARNNAAGVLAQLGRHEEAIVEYRRVLADAPDFADAAFNLGNTLWTLKRFDAAAEAFAQALAIDPGHAAAAGSLVTTRRSACDWRQFEADLALLGRLIDSGAPGADPFITLASPLSPAQLLHCAQASVARQFGRIRPLSARSRSDAEGPVRLAYLSANYSAHAVASLVAELIEAHDRDRFEVTGVSFGPDDGSPMRARLMQGFDRFLDVRGETDAVVARKLDELGIDIAIDLMGHTRDHRMGILAYRPAPVQVSFLGYPGPTGAPFIDYVVADGVVLPRDRQPFWSEEIVLLPGCYQANDSRRMIPATVPSRAECGLPAEGFVFCCFNNNYKITPDIFAIWRRLLQAVPGSVLWLLRDNDDAARHLATEVAMHGIEPFRLIFAPLVGPEQHLARQRQADLFLDTLPYNAHTTASDALRMGLPVVTCPGESFAARVAASLLTALDMPELITPDLAAYEALALDLAQRPDRLRAIRDRLRRNIVGATVFDGTHFRIGLEAAYERMMARHRAGLPPEGFTV